MSSPTTIQAPAPVHAWRRTAPLPYTNNPWQLFFSDIVLFLVNAWSIPFIVRPTVPSTSGQLDELYPSFRNIFDITVHLLIFVAQIAFLVSLPLCLIFLVPATVVFVYVIGFLVTNYLLCKVLLNGSKPILESQADITPFPDKHEDERWIFLNGVAVGSHWLQSNVDRISLSFGRKVLGVHNPTSGIVFDIIQCLIQRDFMYVTQDIRNGFAVLKEALSDHRYKKIVFILHSQGGIEGGLILDWLFAEMPGGLIEKLEVYTFGNAANHFNNPLHKLGSRQVVDGVPSDKSSASPSGRTITHIEHYANHFDFVSRWGVLEFSSARSKKGKTNRFAGRCFERYGKGHQFNQHYLDTMFPLDKRRGYGVLEHNPFMDAEVQIAETDEEEGDWSSPNAAMNDVSLLRRVIVRNATFGHLDSVNSSLLSPMTRHSPRKVYQYSRLWEYRNGMTPTE